MCFLISVLTSVKVTFKEPRWIERLLTTGICAHLIRLVSVSAQVSLPLPPMASTSHLARPCGKTTPDHLCFRSAKAGRHKASHRVGLLPGDGSLGSGARCPGLNVPPQDQLGRFGQVIQPPVRCAESSQWEQSQSHFLGSGCCGADSVSGFITAARPARLMTTSAQGPAVTTATDVIVSILLNFPRNSGHKTACS